MSITFAVDEVEPATGRLPTRALGETLGDRGLLLGPDPATAVIEIGTHPLLAAVHTAFAEHRPLVLSPDAIWLTIAQGVAHHVRLNADALRPRLVRHQGKRQLTVEGPARLDDAAAWGPAIDRLAVELDDAVGPGLGRLLRCDFSTSTTVERTASAVVLLATMSPYFDFAMTCICGIPTVTLLGEPADWRAIRARLDVIAELDLGWWTAALVPIADQLMRTASGDIDRDFWRDLYKPHSAYGGDIIAGWIARLYPYLSNQGRYDRINPLLGPPPPELPEMPWLGYTGPGIRTDEVPDGRAEIVIALVDRDGGSLGQATLEAGLLAVEQDAEGRLVPRAGTLLRLGGSSIAAVMARLEAEHEVEPRRPGRGFSANAELNALYDRVHSATLRSGWRVRPVDELQRIAIVLSGDRTADAWRIVDGPDGTCLAVDVHAGVVAQLRIDQIVAVDGARVGHATRERIGEIPVVGRSLAEVLARLLDGHALLANGSLLDALPEWLRRQHQP